jgi:hypothetical protein
MTSARRELTISETLRCGRAVSIWPRSAWCDPLIGSEITLRNGDKITYARTFKCEIDLKRRL